MKIVRIEMKLTHRDLLFHIRVHKKTNRQRKKKAGSIDKFCD